MRAPTANLPTQGKHGQFNAVDYSARPDPIFYAPEDVTYHAYLLNAGDAGNNLQVTGAHGRHGFCHVEEIYIKPGQTIRKGEPLGKMGYTGLTDPKGPGGRHLHWVIYKNGVYIYPPDLITEPFGGSKGVDMIDTDEKALLVFWAVLHTPPEAVTKEAKASIMNQPFDVVLAALSKYPKWLDQNDKLVDYARLKEEVERLSGQKVAPQLTDKQQKGLQALDNLKEYLK